MTNNILSILTESKNPTEQRQQMSIQFNDGIALFQFEQFTWRHKQGANPLANFFTSFQIYMYPQRLFPVN